MNNIVISFLLTFIAGFSTLLGTFLIFLKFKNQNKIIASSLAFASAVMICISIIDLVPESINMLNDLLNSNLKCLLCFIFIITGIILSMIINYFIPEDNKKSTKEKSLYKVGIVSMLAIILHNIPEGMATFITSNNNLNLGISLTIAIALHNIPEGISISIPIYYSTKSKKKALFYTFISALSEPFGALITYIFLLNIINNTILGCLYALIAGIMIHISLAELLPKSKSYKCLKNTYIFFILGILFILFFH